MEDHHPAQAICLVAAIMWCGTTEQLLKIEPAEDAIEELHWWFG